MTLIAGLLLGAGVVTATAQTDRPNMRPPPPEALRQLDEWNRTGIVPPLPVYDPRTGDVRRNADGSPMLYDENAVAPPPPPGVTPGRP